MANQQELHDQLGYFPNGPHGPDAVGCYSYLRRSTGFQTTHLKGTS